MDDFLLQVLVCPKSGGKLVWMSNVQGDVNISASAVSSILRKEICIYGSWNSSYQPSGLSDWKETVNLIKKGLSLKGK